jgi:hypothetical protein
MRTWFIGAALVRSVASAACSAWSFHAPLARPGSLTFSQKRTWNHSRRGH